MISLSLLCVSFVSAQWVKTDYPNAYSVYMCATESGNLIVCNYDPNPEAGLHISYDKGKTWEVVENVPAIAFTSHYQTQEYVFFAGNGGYLARSVDEGRTWETFEFNSLFQGSDWADSDCYGIVYHHGKLYVGAWRQGVFYSEDFGETWHATDNQSLIISEEVNGRYMYSLASFKDELYLFGANGIWKLNEEDDTWILQEEVWYLSGFVSGDRMYAYCGAMGTPYCLRYTEDGKNWTEIPIPERAKQNNMARFMKVYDGVIFAGFSNSGIFYTMDEGKTWIDISEGLPIAFEAEGVKYYSIATDFAIFENEIYCACFGEGVYKMTRPADFIHSYSDDNSMKVYPDAQTDYLYLHYDPSVKAVLQVTDVYGKEWINTPASEKVNIQNLPSGIYVYSLRVNEERITGKFVKK